MSRLKVPDSPALFLIIATAISAVSLFLHVIAPARTLGTEVALGYVPVLLGCAAMWLCIMAWRNTTHKLLVSLYTIALAPFAFSYPAWVAFIWILYISGRYKGPMP
jgi:hypothetical protein